jgi:hypothetical protein
VVTNQPNLNEMFESPRSLALSLVSEDYEASLVYENDETADILEGYIAEYLDSDVGMGLFVHLPADQQLSLSVYRGVNMWILEFPITLADFYKYLDELDLRQKRMDALSELPDPDEFIEGTEMDEFVSVTRALADLLRVAETDVVNELGSNWRQVDVDLDGYYSNPVRFVLWNERVVVGLDDQYVHLYAPATSGGTGEPWELLEGFELGSENTLTLAEFAPRLRMAAARPAGQA